jgi:hypothetical protein
MGFKPARRSADTSTMAPMPEWLAPQIDAARRERADALTAVGAVGVITLDPVNVAVDTTLDGWLAKEGRSCPHLDEPGTPAYLAFGNPRVLCSTCLDVYQAGITGTPDDRRCDLCGEQIVTPTLAPLIVEVGPVHLMGGICRECRAADG